MSASTTRLEDVTGTPGFVQALIERVHLTRAEGAGLRVRVNLDASTPCITAPSAKRALAASADRAVGRRARDAWDDFARHSRPGDATVIETPGFPIRHGSAGVLPLVVRGETTSALLFFRDIPPIGWNIANGASAGVDELVDLEGPLARELAEELFLRSGDQLLRVGAETAGEADAAASALAARLGLRLEGPPIACRALPGPDTLIVVLAGRRTVVTADVHVVFDEPAFGLECARLAVVDAPEGAVAVDGELLPDGTLLDRPVGRFDIGDLALLHPIPRTCHASGVVAEEPAVEGPDALCPVTRALVERHGAS